MAQTPSESLLFERNSKSLMALESPSIFPQSPEKYNLCPPGQHRLINDGQGNYVCLQCGFEDSDLAKDEQHYASEDDGKESSLNHHQAVNYLMIDQLGSQFDMTSNSNRGQVMELGIGSLAKDYLGRRCKPLLNHAYVVGQYVGKGSDVFEQEQFDLTLACKDSKTKANHEVLGLLSNPLMDGIKTYECPICKQESKIIDSHRYLVPRAKKSFFHDTIYRNTKNGAWAISCSLQFDVVKRYQYSRELEKLFQVWVEFSSKILPSLGLLMMEKKRVASNIITDDMIDGYSELLEKLRLFLVEPLTEASPQQQSV